MRKRSLKKNVLSLTLVMAMLAGVSAIALAGSGNLSFGGMTANWSISSSVMTTTITYSSTVTINAGGNIYESNSSGKTQARYCEGMANATKKLSFTSHPHNGYSFISDSKNNMNVYINSNYIIGYSPTP